MPSAASKIQSGESPGEADAVTGSRQPERFRAGVNRYRSGSRTEPLDHLFVGRTREILIFLSGSALFSDRRSMPGKPPRVALPRSWIAPSRLTIACALVMHKAPRASVTETMIGSSSGVRP